MAKARLDQPTDYLRYGVLKRSLPLLLPVMLGITIGYVSLALPSFSGAVCIFGLILLGLSILRFEIAYYLWVAVLCMMVEVQPMQGSILSVFADRKLPGIPHFIEIAFAFIFLSFSIHYILSKTQSSPTTRRLPFVAFFSLLALSAYVGWTNGVDTILWKEDVKKFAVPCLFFYCSLYFLDSHTKITTLVRFIFLLVIIKCCLGITSYLLGHGFLYGPDQIVVFLESADHLLFLTVIVTVVSVIAHRKTRGEKSFVFFLALCPLFFSIIFSYRRNVWLGLLLSFFILVLVISWKTKVKVVTLCFFSALIFLFLASSYNVLPNAPSGRFLWDRFLSTFETEESSNVAHHEECIIAFEDIMRAPLLGLGLGSTHRPLPNYPTINTHTVHNAFLMLWMKMGPFALALFVLCFLYYVRLGIHSARLTETNELQPVQLGLFSTCGFWLVSLNVGPVWFYYRETCLMALVMAIVVNMSQDRPGSKPVFRKGGISDLFNTVLFSKHNTLRYWLGRRT